MSNRWVFLAAFLTTILIVAGAFSLTQFFYFELAKSAIFMAVAMLVFFNEDKFAYMLGIVFPPLWFLVDILLGVFLNDFSVMFDYLRGRGFASTATPLDGIARLTAIFLFFSALHAWKKDVPDRFIGKTFWTSLAICFVYIGVLSAWYVTRVA
jgi:uncharacterized membrane protein